MSKCRKNLKKLSLDHQFTIETFQFCHRTRSTKTRLRKYTSDVNYGKSNNNRWYFAFLAGIFATLYYLLHIQLLRCLYFYESNLSVFRMRGF